MTYLIDDLVAAGLVERQPNPTDRRQRQVVATPRKAIATLCGQVAAAEAAVLGALDGEERKLFRRLLAKAAAGLADSSIDGCEIIDQVS